MGHHTVLYRSLIGDVNYDAKLIPANVLHESVRDCMALAWMISVVIAATIGNHRKWITALALDCTCPLTTLTPNRLRVYGVIPKFPPPLLGVGYRSGNQRPELGRVAPTRRRVGVHWSGPNGPAPARPWEDATRCSPLRRGYWRAGSRILDRAIVHRVRRGAPGIAQRRRLHGAISLMKDMRVAQALPAFHGETITPSRWDCRIRPLASYRSPC